MIQVHMLWVFGNLSRFEILSIKSFLKNGYAVNLWTYGDITNAPPGTVIKDARTVLGEEHLFLTKGSYANYSDLFRYAVLQQHGGMWSDADVVAVKHADELPQEPFFVVEDIWEGSFRKDKPYTINGNIIYYPEPYEGSVIDLALALALKFPKAKLKWAELGPDLLHNLIELYPAKEEFKVLPVTFANAIPAGEIVERMLKPGIVNPLAHFVHLYNDMWRRENINKNELVIPEGSMLADLMKTYYE